MLTPFALIVVLIVAPLYWAADHPWIAGAVVVGLVWGYYAIRRRRDVLSRVPDRRRSF